MELQDPFTNVTISHTQFLNETVPETISANVTPSDDENSSIITVKSNASGGGDSETGENILQLHLPIDAGYEDNENAASTTNTQSGTDNGGLFLTAIPTTATTQQQSCEDTKSMQTIVEVVSPLISGDGYANKIAVGRFDDCSLPSFDENENKNAANDELDSLNAYKTASELSLSDKMKNVLQELVSNERVRLSLSQSISDDDDENDEEEEDSESEDSDKNDTDVEENELNHDDLDAAQPLNIHQQAGASANDNIADITAVMATATSDIAFNVERTDSKSTDDIKNANVFDYDIIYQNPNFLTANDEMDAHTITSPISVQPHCNEHDEKLKEKLLSELNVDEQKHRNNFESINIDIKSNSGPALTTTAIIAPQPSITSSSTLDADDNESSISIQDADIPSAPTTPTTESSSKSTNNSNSSTAAGNGRRKKRKGKKKIDS